MSVCIATIPLRFSLTCPFSLLGTPSRSLTNRRLSTQAASFLGYSPSCGRSRHAADVAISRGAVIWSSLHAPGVCKLEFNAALMFLESHRHPLLLIALTRHPQATPRCWRCSRLEVCLRTSRHLLDCLCSLSARLVPLQTTATRCNLYLEHPSQATLSRQMRTHPSYRCSYIMMMLVLMLMTKREQTVSCHPESQRRARILINRPTSLIMRHCLLQQPALGYLREASASCAGANGTV